MRFIVKPTALLSHTCSVNIALFLG